MPSFSARFVRFLIRHTLKRRFEKAGQSVPALRKLEEALVRSQRPLRGTMISSASVDGVPAEWIEGPGAASSGALLYFHGGAFVMGSPASHRELASRISAAAAARVLSPDFRLSPEHPFPAAMEDAVTSYGWLLSQGFDPSQIAIGGESSGGGLALQALLKLKKEEVDLPKAAFFLSPVTDWIALDGESYTSRARVDPLLSPAQCRFTSDQYAGENPSEPEFLQPLDMDLSGLPPMWIQAGGDEILVSDAERLAGRAQEDGVSVDLKVWPGMWHCFQATAMFVREARDSIAELGRFLRARFSG